MKKIVCALFCLFGLFACEPDDEAVLTPDYLVFGQYYGECAGGEICVEIYKLADKSLYEDTNDLYPNPNKRYTGNYVLQDAAQYEKVKDLIKAVPAKLLKEETTVIGQPDAGDWGGYYIEVRKKRVRKFYLIDTKQENIPPYLHLFTDKVKASIRQLQ